MTVAIIAVSSSGRDRAYAFVRAASATTAAAGVLVTLLAGGPAAAVPSPSVTAGAQAGPDATFLQHVTKPCTHHVAMNGSDTNLGTTPQDAWRTIAKAMATLTQGQTACVHAGTQPYAEGRLEPANSGGAMQPIAIMAAPGEPRPRIMANGDVTMFSFGPNIGFWVVDGLDIDKDQKAGASFEILGGHHVLVNNNVIRNGKSGAAVLVRGHTASATTDVLIRGNDIFDHHRWVTSSGTVAFTRLNSNFHRDDANAINVESVNGSTIARVEVKGNQLHNVGGDGLQCEGVKDLPENSGGGPSPSDAMDLDIVGNRVFQTAEEAVDIKSCQRVSIRGSVSPAGGGSSADNKFFGFRPTDMTADLGGKGGNNAGGGAIVVHYWARGVLIENTRIWDNCQGIAVGREDTQVENVVIRRTLIFGLVGQSASVGQGATKNVCQGLGIRIGRAAHVDIYHVTIDGAPEVAIRLARDNSPTDKPTIDVDVWNNIIDGGSGAWFDVDLTKLSGSQSDNNVFWHPDGSTSHFKLVPPPGLANLANWQSRTGGQDQNSHHGDPLFVADPQLNDYYTRLGSPARDAARPNTGPVCNTGGAPDIGFLESCQ